MVTTTAQADAPIPPKPLRLWPGVAIVVLQWLLRFGVLFIMPEAITLGILGALLCGAAIIVWWAFFSRAPRSERWGGVALMAATLAATSRLIHESMRLLPFVAHIIPVLSLAFVIWAVATRRLSDRPRRALMVATVLLACGVWTLFRTGGITGGFESDFAWRWTETPEERMLAQDGDEPTALPPPPATAEAGASWPGFRGPDRDGIIRGVRIETDWSAFPPVELWRRPIGPGWSSFAVRGDFLYTQEQRGDDEVVACYSVTTGVPVWRHRDATRFWESNAGAGPRGTPTLMGGRLYSLGATGILNVLQATDGALVWSRNAAYDTDTEVPIWGFSGSPLVVGELVIVAAAGSLIAYDLATGGPRWFNTTGGDCYSSPHLVHVDGVAQVLLLNNAGASSVAPADGALLWEYPWPGHPIVQPALTANGDILITADERTGLRRITAALGPDGWSIVEHWTSARLKPYFNDSVIHDGHAYGFDGRSIACIDVADGERR